MNPNSFRSRRSSATSHGTDLHLNLDKHSISSQKNNKTCKIEKLTISFPALIFQDPPNQIYHQKRYTNLISALVKCIKKLIEISCSGPNQKDILKSLATTKIMQASNCKMDTYYNAMVFL